MGRGDFIWLQALGELFRALGRSVTEEDLLYEHR